MEKTNIVMPSGKYKGKDVADVPLPYLRWFLANVRASKEVTDAVSERIYPQIIKKLNRELNQPVEGMTELELMLRNKVQFMAIALKRKRAEQKESEKKEAEQKASQIGPLE